MAQNPTMRHYVPLNEKPVAETVNPGDLGVMLQNNEVRLFNMNLLLSRLSVLEGKMNTIKEEIHNEEHPIGSTYITEVAESPASIFGGTWELIGKGQAIVGVDGAQTEFNVAGKTGGSKSINLEHNHTVNAHQHTSSFGYDNLNFYGSNAYGATTIASSGDYDGAGRGYTLGIPTSDKVAQVRMSKTSTESPATNSKLSAEQSVLQPYLALYVWKRTA